MRPNDYLNNPVIDQNFYNVKCTNVEVLDGNTLIQLRVVPYEPYGEAQEQVLHVTLRDSPKVQPIFDRFQQTFRITQCPTEAIGRFGCIGVGTSTFRDKRYSAVHFIRQSDIAKKHARSLEQADRDGLIPWQIQRQPTQLVAGNTCAVISSED